MENIYFLLVLHNDCRGVRFLEASFQLSLQIYNYYRVQRLNVLQGI